MPGLEDWVNGALGIIQNIYDQHSDDMKLADNAVKEYFSGKLQSKNALSWIPSLNNTPLHTLRPNSLVRYRCMVQDMFDPEFYLGSYEVKDVNTQKKSMKSGKYKDIAECGANQEIDLESPKNKTLDRQTLYCVPIPGESSWVKESYAECAGKKVYPSTSSTPARCKRSLDEDAVTGAGLETGSAMETNMEESTPMATSSVVSESVEPKRTRTHEDKGSTAQALPDLNFPLPGETGVACLVKIYDDLDGFCVNDVVEFVGVLSVDPSLAQFDADKGSDGCPQNSIEDFEISMEERNAHAPPPSLVPRLHAILSHKHVHNNPLLTALSTEEDNFKGVLAQLQGEIVKLRQQIISTLEHITFGDTLAAEYLLCHLISTVYARADVLPLGKYCLNLSQCPANPEYSQFVHKFVSAITTKSYLLPISIENMNKFRLSPQKDYTANRLLSGILQLSNNTSLVLDETSLQPGQLEANGVKNMTALGNLINWQKVEYDFSYHRQEFLSNVAVLVLSEAKSILPSDALVPLSTSLPPSQNLHDHFVKLDTMLNGDFLQKFRLFITVAKLLDYTMTDDVQKSIQDDFVDLRREDPKNMTADDFHRLLNLVRLISLSHLKTSASRAMWDKAKSMEAQRKQRLQ